MLRVAFLCCLLGLFATFDVSALSAQDNLNDGKQIIYLHTEFHPYKDKPDDVMVGRLTREIGRQGFLAAARSAFGLITRDGTLKESVPEGPNVVHLALLQRITPTGKKKTQKVHQKVFRFDKASGVETHGL